MTQFHITSRPSALVTSGNNASIAGNLTVVGTVSVGNVALRSNASTMTIGGNVSTSGTVSIGNIALTSNASTMTIGGNVSTSGVSIGNIALSANASTMTIGGNVSTAGSFSIGNIAMTSNATTLTIGGNISASYITGNGSGLTGISSPVTIASVAITNSSGTLLDDTALGPESYLTILGTGFGAGAVVLLGSVAASLTNSISQTQLRARFVGVNPGTYSVFVMNTDGTSAVLASAVTWSEFPIWSTTSIAPATKTRSISRSLAATGDSNIAYTASSTPPGTTLSTSGILSGTITEFANTTSTYSFTVQATDAQMQNTPATFSLSTGFIKNLTGNANVVVSNATYTGDTNHLAVSNSGGYVKFISPSPQFLSGASVLLNNAAVSSTFVSSTEVRAVIPASTEGSSKSLEIVNVDGSVLTNAGGPGLAQWALPNWQTPSGQVGISATFTVTVVNDGGNVFAIDGINKPYLNFLRGGVYTFTQSNATNSNHPIAFKDASGAAYTTGVVSSGTPGSAGAQTVITVASDAPSELRYYCTVHGNGMGSTIVVSNALLDIGAPMSRSIRATHGTAAVTYAQIGTGLTGSGIGIRNSGGYTGAWTARTTVGDSWSCIAWSPTLNIFVVLPSSGSTNSLVSSNGITWTTYTAPAPAWSSIVWASGLNIFVAVATSGTGNRAATSSDGINWTSRTTPADNEWRSIAYAPSLGLFAAVASSGTGNRVMTSTNGTTWTIRTSAADVAWRSVAWSPELGMWAAVATTPAIATAATNISTTLTGLAGISYTPASPAVAGSVMTSTDGVTWTVRVSPSNEWRSIVWAPELGIFAAIAQTGSSNRVMTSSNGITWVSRTTPSAADISWTALSWSPELGTFAAVASSGTGNRVLTSLDGVAWSLGFSPADNEWQSIAWSPSLGIFASVSSTGTGTRAMTAAATYSTGIILSGTVTASANIAFVMNAIASATLQNATREFTLSVVPAVGGVLYTYTTHTFTNAGVTGQNGPSLAQCRAAYSTTWDENSSYFNMTTNGIQLWTVPRDGTIRITAKGAQGGERFHAGGSGAIVRSDHIVTSGTILQILVGQMGGNNTTASDVGSAGGGGSFVVRGISSGTQTLLIAAGGGSGAGHSSIGPGQPGVFTLTGGTGQSSGGTNGNGGGLGAYAGGGGGFFTRGSNQGDNQSSGDTGGLAFVDGGRGGNLNNANGVGAAGGFGGGGGQALGSGGGGGASGGSGGGWTSPNGGGGGSFSATTQTNVGTGTGHGYVTIEYL